MKMSPNVSVCCFFALLVCSLATPLSPEWRSYSDFVRSYNRRYINDTSTLLERFEIFKESLRRHRDLNEKERVYGGTAVYGVNKFSDLTPAEFQSLYLSPPREMQTHNVQETPLYIIDQVAPDKLDWRTKYVTPIKNQKQCGSCWAFSVVESLESRLAIDNNSSAKPLSVQEVISCEQNDTAKLFGCDGGLIFNAFERVKDDKLVIVSESAYPFTGHTGSCKSNLPKQGLRLDQYVSNSKLDEDKMLNYINEAPTSNSASAVMWQDYLGGIIQHHCTSAAIDHAVQVVGYNLVDDPVPYWIVRNTWGTDWGEDGYLRIKKGGNICGISEEVVLPTVVTYVSITY